jgi:hypothetical protein
MNDKLTNVIFVYRRCGMDRNKTARPFRSVCPEPVLASDCTCRIRKEGSRENGAVFLNVMLGAEPPHQGGGRHGQDLRCAFDCDAEFSFCFPKKRTIICQDRLRTSAATTKSSKSNQRRFFLAQAYFVRYWLSAGRGNFNVSPAGCTPPNFYVVRNLRLSWF